MTNEVMQAWSDWHRGQDVPSVTSPLFDAGYWAGKAAQGQSVTKAWDEWRAGSMESARIAHCRRLWRGSMLGQGRRCVGAVMTELKRCPCGEVPTDLAIEDGPSSKYAYVCCDVCGEWAIEFRTVRYDQHSPESYVAAVCAWNAAPRGDSDD